MADSSLSSLTLSTYSNNTYYSTFFNGSTDYLSIAQYTPFLFSGGNFTIECWIYPTTTSVSRGIVNNWQIGGAFGWNLTTGNVLSFQYTSAASGVQTQTYNGTTIISPNIWTHVAVVRVTNSLKFYINGVADGTTFDMTSFPTIYFYNGATKDLKIGVGSDTAGYFTGYFSNLRILKGTGLYTTNFNAPIEQLTAIANTVLLTCQNITFVDNSVANSGVGWTIVKNGTPGPKQFTPPLLLTSSATLTPTYTSGTLTYTFNAPVNVAAIRVTPTANDAANATIKFGGNVTLTSGQPTVASAAPYNNSGYSANFVSGLLQTAYNPSLNVSGYAWTIEFWTYITTSSLTCVFFTRKASGATTGISYQGGLFQGVASFSFAGNTSYVLAGTPLPLNAWAHVAYVYDGGNTVGQGNVSVYFNGAKVNNFLINTIVDNTEPLTIGGSRGLTEWTVGNISNFRMVKGYQLYNGSFTPPTQPYGLTQPASAGVNAIVGPPANGYSGYFNGTNMYLSVASDAAFGFGTGNFTIECWFNTFTPASAQAIYDTRSPTDTANAGYDLYLTSSVLRFGTSGTNYIIGTTTIIANQWYHVAVVRESTTVIKMYLNGVQEGPTYTASATQNFTNSTPRIGFGPDGYFSGYLSNLRIVKGTALYTATFAPSSAPLTAIANTSLLAIQNSLTSDASTNNFTITNNNSAVLSTTFSPYNTVSTTLPINGSSVFFNGSSSISGSADFRATGDFTIECWFYPTVTTECDILKIGSEATGRIVFGTGLPAAGNLFYNIYGGSSIVIGAVGFNAWQHIAIVRIGTTITGYVNGIAGTPSTSVFGTLGNSSGFSTMTTGTGYITNLHYVSGIGLYNTNFNVYTSPLVAITNTKLLAFQSSVTTDASTNNYTLTATGTPTLSTTITPFITVGAFSSQYLSTALAYQQIANPFSPALSMGQGHNNFTAEAWVYINSSGVSIPGAPGYFIMQKGTGATGGVEWAFSVYNTGIYFTYTSGIPTGTTTSTSITANIVTGRWMHLAFTKVGTSLHFWLNGTYVYTLNGVNNLYYNAQYNSYFTVANTQTGSGAAFPGFISNARVVYGKAIYTTNYDTPFIPSTTPLTLTQSSTATAASIDNPRSYTVVNGSSVYFNNTNDFLTFPEPAGPYYSVSFQTTQPSLNSNAPGFATAFALGTGDFTIETWFRITGNSPSNGADSLSNAVLLSMLATSGVQTGWSLIIFANASSNTGTAGIGFTSYISDTQTSLGRTTATLLQNIWYHVAVSRISGTSRLFLNGVLVDTQSSSQNLTNSNNVTIASSLQGTPFLVRYFTGYMSNTRIVNGTGLYSANFTPSNKPLTLTSQGANPQQVVLLINQSSDRLKDNSLYNFPVLAGGGTTHAAVNIVPFTSQYDVTVEAWIMLGVAPTTRGYIINNSATTTGYFGVAIEAARTITVWSDSNVTAVVTSAIVIPLYTWTHIAVTYVNNLLIIYVNGVRDTNTVAKTTIWQAATLGTVYIGRQASGAAQYFPGYITNLRMVYGTAVYTGKFTVPTSPLTAISDTVFLGLQSSVTLDASINNATITKGSGATGLILAPLTSPFTTYLPTVTNGNSISFGWLSASSPSDYLYFNTISGQSIQLMGDFTVETWCYFPALPPTQGFLFDNRSTTTDAGIVWYVNTNGTMTAAWNNGSLSFTSTVVLAINTWYHLALTRQLNTTKFWINGVQDITTYTSNTTNHGGNNLAVLYFNRTVAGYTWSSYFSNYRVISSTCLYTGTFTPSLIPYSTTTDSKTNTLSVNGITTYPTISNSNGLTYSGSASISGSYAPNISYLNGTGIFELSSFDFTIETWFNCQYITNSQSSQMSIASATGTSGTDYSWNLYLTKYLYVGTITFYAYYGAAQSSAITLSTTTPTINLNSNQWYHISVVRIGTTITMYLNGAPIQIKIVPSALYLGTSTNARLVIGGRYNGSAIIDTFLGYISNLRVIKGYGIYTGLFLPSTTPLSNMQSAINNSNTISGTSTSLLALQNSTTTDASSNAFTLTANGGPTVSSTIVPNLPTTNGYSVYFNGTLDYIQMPLASSPATAPSGQFTLEAWIYCTNIATNPFIASSWYTSYPAYSSWQLGLSSSGYLQFSYGIGSVTNTITGTTGVVTSSTWAHVAVTRNSSNLIILYVNGVADGTTATVVGTFNNAVNSVGVRIGSGVSSGLAWYLGFQGYISNVRFVTGITVYTGTFTPPTSPLTVTQSSGTNISAITSAASNAYSLAFVGDQTLGQYLTVLGGAGNFSFGTANYTIECWAYAYTQSDGRTVFNMYSGVGGYGTFIRYSLTTGWQLYYNNGGNASTYTFNSTNSGIGFWVHHALVRSSGTLYWYINGVNVFTAADATNYVYTTLDIGYYSSSIYNWIGYISNFRIVKGVAIYTSGTASFTVPTSPLTAVAGTLVLTGQNATIIDNSTYGGTGFNIANNYNVTTTALISPFISGSTQLLVLQANSLYGAMTDASPSNFIGTATGTTSSTSTTNITPYVVNNNMTYSPFLNSNGRSVFFTGSSQYITAPSNTAFTFGTNDFTIEGWIYLTAATSSGTLYDARTGLTTISAQIYIASNIVNYAVAGVSVINSSTLSTLSSTTWYHIAVVRISNVTKLYVNGIQAGNSYVDNNNYVIGAPYIGTGYNSTNPLNGYISNLRVVKGTGVYSNSFLLPVAPLTITQSSSANLVALNNAIPTLGNSVYFNGTSDYMKVPSAISDMGTGDFTIEMYFFTRWTDFTTSPYLISQYYSDTTGLGYWRIQILTGGIISVLYDGISNFNGTGTVLVNEWCHIALVRISGTITLYLNGINIGTQAYSGKFGLTSAAAPVWIGAGSFSGPLGYWQGYLSNLRFVKGLGVYTGAFTVPANPLTATQSSDTNIAAITGTSTSLLLYQNSPYTDNSAYNATVTGFGNPHYTPVFGPSFFSYPTPANANSGYFNGSSFLTLTQPTNAGSNDFTIELWVYPKSIAAISYLLSTSLTTPTTVTTNNGYVGLNGTSQYLTVPSNNGFVFGTGDFTIECWVYTTVAATNGASTTDRFIFGAIGNTPSWTIYLQNGATLIPSFYSAVGSLSSSIPVITSAWTHIAVVRYSGNMYIYVNGLLGGTVANSSNYTASGTQYIGRADDAANKYFNGNISNLRVVKGTAVYVSNFTPTANALTATQGGSASVSAISAGVAGTSGTQLLVLQSALTTDASVNNITLTAVGSPTLTATGGPFGASQVTAGCFHLWIATTGLINLAVDTTTASITSVLPFAAKTNTWTHIAITRTNGVIYMYINGYRQAGTVAKTTLFGDTGILSIGRYQPSLNQPFTGYITNVRFVYGSPAQYISGFVPPPITTPLTAIANTTLLLLQTTVTKDNSVNNVTVTNSGVLLSTYNNPYTTMKLPITLSAQSGFTDGNIKENGQWAGAFNVGSVSYASWMPTVSPFGVTPSLLLGQSGVVRDDSINNYVPVVAGSPNLMRYVTPFSGNAVAFNGSTSYITGTNLYNSLGGDFTIEFFMMAGPQTATQGGLILSRNVAYNVATNNNYYIMCSHPGLGTYSSINAISATSRQTIQIYTYNTNATPVFMGSTPVCDSKWHHIAIVRISGIVKVYVDGVLDTDSTNSFANTSTWDYSNFSAGSNSTDGTQTVASLAYNGMLSNLRIINGTGIYTNTFTPPTNNLTTSQSSRTNVVQYTPSVPTSTGYSLSFPNGTNQYMSIMYSSVLNLGLNDYTIEFWNFLSGPSNATQPCLFALGAVGNTGCIVMFAGNTQYGNKLKYQLSLNSLSALNPGTIDYMTVQTAGNVIYGKWTHIALVRRSGILSVYINGVVDITTGYGNYSVYAASGYFYIGNLSASTTLGYISGFISNFRVVNGIAVYTGNFTVPTSALTTTQSSGTNIAAITNTTLTNGGALWYQYGGYHYIANNQILNAAPINITVECWVYFYAMPNNNTWSSGAQNVGVVYAASSNNTTTGIHFAVGTTNIFIAVANGTYGGYPHNMTVGTWYHLAYVINNSVVTFYVNGVSVGNISGIPFTYTATTYNFMGTSSTGDNFIGSGAGGSTGAIVSNLRVLKSVALYTSNFIPSTSPLTNTQSSVTNINAITGTSTSLLLQNSVTTDASTNAFTLTAGGSPSVNTSFYPSFAVTNAYSAYFRSNGISSQYASLRAPLTTSIIGTGTFTVECWIYPIPFSSSTSAYQIIIGNDTTGGLSAFGINPSGTIFYGYISNVQGTTSALYTVKFNAWNHLALVRNVTSASSIATIYINGVAGYAGTNTTSYIQGITRIGTEQSGATYPYTGYISNLRIVNGVAVYTSNFTVPTAALTVTQSANTNGNPSAALALNTYAGNFNGTTQYLTVPTNATPLILGNNNFTIECWIYPTTASQSTWFIDFRPTSLNGDFPALGLTSGTVYYYTNAVTRITGSIAGVYIWTHVALVKNSGITTLYINGGSVGTFNDTTSYAVNLSTSPVIGTYGYTRGGTGFVGYISNVRIVNGVAVYTGSFTPPTTQLTATQNAGTNISPIGTLTTTNGYYSNYFNYLTSQYLTVTGSSLVFGTFPFTIETWVFTISPVGQTIIDNMVNQTGAWLIGQWQFGLSGSYNLPNFYYTTGISTAVTITSSIGVPSGQWTHVAAVRSNTGTNGFAIYVNGVVGVTATLNVPIGVLKDTTTTSTTSSIATTTYYKNVPYYGFISNLRITNLAVYTGAFNPQFTPLTNTQSAVTSTQSSLLALRTTSIIDESTNAFTLTSVGSPAISGSVTPFVANNGSSVFFTPNQYLYAAPLSSIYQVFTGDFTVEFWAYCTNSSTVNCLFMNYAGTSDISFYMGFTPVAGQLSYGGYNTYTTLSVAATSVLFNVWTHIAYVRINSVETVYFNGVSVSTSTRTLNFTSGTLYVGIQPAIGQYFSGYMSNFRVIKGLGVYTGNFTVPTTPLTITQSSGTNISAITGTAPTNGSSVNFNGSSYLNTTGSSQLEFGNNTYTIEFWFYLTSVTVLQQLYDLRGSGSTNNSSYVFAQTNSTINYGFGSSTLITSSTTVAAQTWYHLAIVRTNQSTNGVTMYLNGINVGTGTDGSTHFQFGLRLGAASPSATAFVTGYMSNFRILVGTALYTSNFAIPNSPLTAITNTRVLALQNSTTTDASANNFTFTATGTTTLSTTISPFIYTTNWLIMQNSPTTDASIYNSTPGNAGGAVISTRSPFTVTNGYSTQFTGSSQYIKAPSNTAFTFGTNDFTIEGWIYLSINTSSGTLYDGRTATNSLSPVIYIDSNRIYYAVGSTVVITGIYIASATWYHIAISRLSGSTSLFVNGLQTSNIYADSNNYVIGAPYIGTGYNSSNPLTGYISNIRVVKTALYNNSFVPSNVPLNAAAGGNIAAISASVLGNGYYANYFNGTSSYLYATAGTQNVFGTGDFTAEMWIYPQTGTLTTNGIAVTAASTNTGWNLGYGTNGFWKFSTYNTVIISAGTVVYSIWTHVAAVRSSGTITLYVNGVSVGTSSTAYTFSDNVTPTIGLVPGGGYLLGYISNVRLTKGVAVYTGTFTPQTTPLTVTQSAGTNIAAITGTAVSLLTCQSITTIDNSTFNATITNTSVVTLPASGALNITGVSLLTCQSSTMVDNSTWAATVVNAGSVFVQPVMNLYANKGATQLLALQTNNNVTLDSSMNAYTLVNSGTTTTVPAAGLFGTAIVNLLALQSSLLVDTGYYATTLTPSGLVQLDTLSPYVAPNGNSIFFNGDNQYISAPSNAVYTFGTGDFTIEGWIYLIGNTKTGTLYDSRTGLTTVSPQVYINNNIVYYAVAGSNVITGPTITAAIWYHVAVVRISSVTKLYINGIQSGSTYADSNNYVIGSPYIGQGYNNSNPLTGYISNVRVVKGVGVYVGIFTTPTTTLTSIQSSVQNTKSLSALPLTGYYSGYFEYPAYLTFTKTVNNTLAGNAFTIETWVYFTQWGNANGVYWGFGLFTSGAYVNFNITFMGTTATSYNSILISANNAAVFSGSSFSYNFQLGTWYHVAVTRTVAGVYNVFVNGTSTGTYTNTGTWVDSTTYYIGYTVPISGVGLYESAGFISNFRITLGQSNYLTNFTPSTTALTTTQNANTNGNPSLAIAQSTGTGYYNLVFTGSASQYLTLSGAGHVFGTNPFTIECWVYAISFSGSLTIIDNFTSNTAGSYVIGSWRLYLNATSGVPTFVYATSVSATSAFSTLTGPSLTSWTHIAVVRTSASIGGFNIYINGVSGQGNTLSQSIGVVNSNTQIGTGSSSSGSAFNGYITNIRLTNGVALYTNLFVPQTTPFTTTQTAQSTVASSLLALQNSTTTDASTNNLTLTATGSPTVSSTVVPYMPVTNGYSVYFNGSSYISLTTQTAFGLGTGDFTIELWVYLTSTAGNTIADFRTGITATATALSISNRQLQFYDGPANNNITFANATVTLNQWSHVAYVRASNIVTGYINGVAAGTTTVTSNLGSTQPIWIGNNQTAGNTFNGYMSNFRIVKGLAVYTGAFTPPTSPLAITQSSGTNIAALPGGSSTYYNSFNGTNQYLTTPNNTAFSLNGSSYTIELWAYWNNISGEQVIVERFTAASGPGYTLYKTTSNTIQLYGTGIVVTSTSTLVANTWYHIAISYNGTNTRVFVNGTQEATAALNITDSASPLVIGSRNSGASTFFNGFISNLRIVKGVAVYTGNFTVPSVPLTTTQSSGTNISAITTGQTVLLTCQSSLIIDNSASPVTFTNPLGVTTAPTSLTPIYVQLLMLQNSVNTDASVNSFNAGITGTPTLNTTDMTYMPFVNSNGRSVFFTGSTQYINAPSNSVFTFGTANFTIEGYIYLRSGTTSGTLYDSRTGASTVSPQIYIASNIVYYAVGGTVVITGSYIASATWYHIAVVKSSGNTKLYINGIQYGSTYTDSNDYVIGSPFIGTGFGSSNPLNGYISNLRVIKGTALYSSAFTTPITALTANAVSNVITALPAPTTSNGYYATAYSGLTTQYLSVPGTPFVFSTNAFTVECWVYINSLTAQQTLIDNFVTGPSASFTPNQWQLYITTSGTVAFNYATNASTVLTPTTTTTVSLGIWTHIAVVRTSTSTNGFVIYINGIAGVTATVSFGLGVNVTSSIGIQTYSKTLPMTGFISNIRITNLAVYTGAFTIPAYPLATTQSSDTNIAAITGTSVALLTSQSSTIVDNSTFAVTITNTGAVVPAVAFGLFNNSGVSLLTAQNATFIDNSVNGVTITNTVSPAVTTAQVYGLFGTSYTALLALQTSSLIYDASINNTTLATSGTIQVEKTMSPMGGYAQPSLLVWQSGVNIDNSVNQFGNVMTVGTYVGYQTVNTPFGALTPTALLTAQSNVLLTDATGYHAMSQPQSVGVMAYTGNVTVNTAYGPFNNDVALLAFQNTLVTDYGNNRTQMTTVGGGGVAPTDASPFSSKSLTSLLIPHGYNDISIGNTATTGNTYLLNNANIAAANVLLNPFVIPTTAVTVLGLQNSNILIESGINNGTFTTSGTAPTSNAFSPFGTYYANGMITLNISNTTYANLTVTSTTPAPSSTSNYSIAVLNSSNIGNRDVSGSVTNPGGTGTGYGFSYANANITIADVANSNLSESLGNVFVSTANYRTSFDSLVGNPTASYGLPNVGNLTLTITDTANSNLAETLINANIPSTNYFKSYDSLINPIGAGQPNVGPSNVTLSISDVANSTLSETLYSYNLGSPNYYRQSDALLNPVSIPYTVPTPVGGVILLITYSYTDGVPIVAANVQSGSGSGTFAANTQIWTQT